MDYKEVEKILKKEGFVLIRSNKHKLYRKGNKTTTIPLGNREVGKKMLNAIERQTGIKLS